jgi:hypothetical protein
LGEVGAGVVDLTLVAGHAKFVVAVLDVSFEDLLSLDDGGDVVLDDHLSPVLFAGLFVELLGHFSVELGPCDLVKCGGDFVLVEAGMFVESYPGEGFEDTAVVRHVI